MSELPLESSALVFTDRAARYAKQLVSHMAKKSDTHWDAETETGFIDFGDAGARAELRAVPEGLHIDLCSADDEARTRFERVVGIHLIRFGRKDNLECAWQRKDGSKGSVQNVDMLAK